MDPDEAVRCFPASSLAPHNDLLTATIGALPDALARQARSRFNAVAVIR